jgi:chaperonin GroES
MRLLIKQNTMNIKPVSDHIVVKGVAKETTSASGIIIPETVSKERAERGEVVAVGPGRVLENGTRSPMEVVLGQTVMFKKYAPDEVKIDGQEYLVIRSEDVIAIIE